MSVKMKYFPWQKNSGLTGELTLYTDPDFYVDGNQFYVWANQYANPINESRVVQTAKAFVQGYLGEFADAYGTIVSINSTGSVDAIGNSLGPSDACPAFSNGASGSDFDNSTDCEPFPNPKQRADLLTTLVYR